MSKNKLFQHLLKEVDQPFAGWDFSYLSQTGRWQSEPLPWSYASTLWPYLRNASSLLDMGTGGGEFLSLLAPLPAHTCATEGHPPNFPLAQQRLEPLGVKVFKIIEETNLPFNDAEFELTINRHESYDANEVYRILQHDGFFITQQVGDQNDIEINVLFGTTPDIGAQPWTAKSAAKELQGVGFDNIKIDEAFPRLRFYDVGAIVYFLKAIPWIIPDFSVDQFQDVLYQLHERIQSEGFLEIHEHRFLIVSQKSGS
ncbi:MAG: class I SAM-dependent methyltransferase [Candidatus Hermodarchaeota archaeon]